MSGKQNKRRLTRATAGGAALLLGVALLPVGLMSTQPANAAGVGAGLSITADDLAFILKQIQISEAHATNSDAAGAVIAPTPLLNCTVLPCVSDPTIPEGLRQVDGRNNNLFTGAPTVTAMAAPSALDLGAADRPFPRLQLPGGTPAPANWRATEAGTIPLPPPATYIGGTRLYSDRSASVQDSQPRLITNLIADQNPNTNPAAQAAAGGPGAALDVASGPLAEGLQNPGATAFIPNLPPVGVLPGQPLPQPTSGMFTLFGQFFDHGLDLVGKTGNEVVIVPLPADDPLRASGASFIAANRTVVDGNLDGKNTTTPWIDQNQTYTSHASHQVFLREYATVDGKPTSSGNLLDGPGGNISNWSQVKAQASAKLGIILTDADIFNVPLLLTDEYGNFLPGANGFPQMVVQGGGVVSAAPGGVAIPANAVRTGHAFLDDIAHSAVPSAGKTADSDSIVTPAPQPANTYDDELLGRHFITGDGRGNENIGLTAIHTMFHSEHNRLVADIDSIVNAPGNQKLLAGFEATGWTYGERLFQAARFVNEMEYQHAVFEEFARTLSPAIRPFGAYDPLLNPDISAEFAHAVYRFGHSMLRENVDRVDANGKDIGMPLLNAFLSPVAFNANGQATAAQAAGSVARGMNAQRGSEIDEFVTSTLRNSLLGLPLDLGVLNIVRGRDTGTPSPNQARAAFGLAPYASWTAFGNGLRHGESLVNFIAAYGKDPSLTAAGNSAGARRAAATLLLNNSAFMTGPAAATGVSDIDLWMGGLAELPDAAAGNILGPTFNVVFQTTLENLQEGDRFYYLDRLAGLNLLSAVEGNLLSEMFQRNTDAEVLPAAIFLVPSMTVDMRIQPTPKAFPNPGPGNGSISENAASAPYTRDVAYSGSLNVTIGGTSGRDHVATGVGDDTLRGGDGGDWLNSDQGADVTLGGNGDDILINTGGADNMLGGPGNDVFDGGPNGDVMQGNAGADYMSTGTLGAVALGGSNNERMLGGPGVDGLDGDDGDDWIEGGFGSDTLGGDTIAPFGVDINTPGEDVLIGGPGTADAYDGGGRMDVFVGQSNVALNGTVIPQIDDYLGGLGFDWTTYYGSRTSVADTANFAPALPANDPGLLLDSFIDVEALSGGDFPETLKGDDRTTLAGITPDISDGMDPADIPSITGLQALLGAGVTSWRHGNILIGGSGGDTLEGRGGDDLIDGNAYLTAQLSVPNGPSQPNAGPGGFTPGRSLVASLGELLGGVSTNARILAGEVNPADLFAVKTIVPNTGDAGIDVAVFSGSQVDYTFTQGPGGTTLLSGPDGNDVLRNIEQVKFGVSAPVNLSSIVAGAPSAPSAAVTPVNPNTGTSAGGTTVTITGSGFQNGAGVTFGGVASCGGCGERGRDQPGRPVCNGDEWVHVSGAGPLDGSDCYLRESGKRLNGGWGSRDHHGVKLRQRRDCDDRW
ncbi:MAG: IPT/TIG domain-containing protein [Actinobacteria bacterium]|nr:IPT/TIG domain-containing protein [Actinomycetota bacterium]